MKFFQEITVWREPNAVNHIYYLSDDHSKMVGYIKHGTVELVKFKSPISFYTSGRKFKLISRDAEPDSAYFTKSEPLAITKNVIEVTGSAGNKYYITKHGNNYSCSCSGFQFRRSCKHTLAIKETQ